MIRISPPTARWVGAALAIVVAIVLAADSAAAQASQEATSIDLDGRLVFYGDNTEFSNEFREGQTLVGTFAELFAEARLNDRIALRAGVFAHQSLGSDDSFDLVRPVLALVVGGPRSRLIFGTLETGRYLTGAGPDRTGAHGLLPPVQRDTLLFERPWEAGIQWTTDSPRFTQDAWVNWQKLNTRTQREVFDVGLVSRIAIRPDLAVRLAGHIVHQGGQLSAVGEVSDHWTTAIGLEGGRPIGPLDRLGVEASWLFARSVPDRERPEESERGVGGFVRLSAERAPWRMHAILWRASDFIKREGDPHYQALRRDGTHFRALRDYLEVGLTRTARLAPGAFLETSLRWHRVEKRYEYSFRLLAVAQLRTRIK